MAEFKKHDKNDLWRSPLVLGAIFCMVVVFMYNMVGIISRERETAKKKALILNQINTLNAREIDLAEGIDTLKTEKGAEEAIREKYQVVKEGEKMVVIVDEQKSETEGDLEVQSDHSFWGFIKKIFQ